MSDFADTYEDDESIYDEPVQETNPVRSRMKQLEKENREAKKLVAELQSAAKELSFAKAGIDVTDPRFKYFVKGYDGEPTPEAIRQAAEEAQLITPQATPQDMTRQPGSRPTGLLLEPKPHQVDHLGENESVMQRHKKNC